jgi:hypothetical protein
MCRVVVTVLIDQETVYARGRATIGFVKAGDRWEKDPDRRVQVAIVLVFDKVEELGSARRLYCGSTSMGSICQPGSPTAMWSGAGPITRPSTG